LKGLADDAAVIPAPKPERPAQILSKFLERYVDSEFGLGGRG
jgi:hypothetical protein